MAKHDDLYDEDGDIRKDIHDKHHEHMYNRSKFFGEIARTVVKTLIVMAIVSSVTLLGMAIKESFKQWLQS